MGKKMGIMKGAVCSKKDSTKLVDPFTMADINFLKEYLHVSFAVFQLFDIIIFYKYFMSIFIFFHNF